MVTSIDPATCDRTTVYAGECRNFADTEWIRFLSGRRRSPKARNTWLVDVANGSFWVRDDQVRHLVHLVPARQVSSDDPAAVQRVAHVLRDTVAVDWEKRAALILAAVAEQLNARGGFPNITYWTIRDGQIVTDATADDAECELARVKRERNAAVARAEKAEQLIPAYAMLDVWGALGRDSIHFDDWYDERGYADAWAELAAGVREAAETHDDPAVFAVRESDIAAVEVKRMQRPSGSYRWDSCDGTGSAVPDGDEAADNARKMVELRAKGLVSALAVQRAIEAEQSVDRVAELAALIESSARKIVQSAANALAVITGEEVRVDVDGLLADVHPDAWRQMARHALEQDASSDE